MPSNPSFCQSRDIRFGIRIDGHDIERLRGRAAVTRGRTDWYDSRDSIIKVDRRVERLRAAGPDELRRSRNTWTT